MEHLMLLTYPDVIPGLIERGTVGELEMEELSVEYRKFLGALISEWPHERIKEWVLAAKRVEYQRSVRHIKKLELDNRDARVRGVSFKERQRYHRLIEIGYARLDAIRKEGIAAKTVTYSALDYVQSFDMATIKARGFEKHLEYAIFGYPQVFSQTPCALTGESI